MQWKAFENMSNLCEIMAMEAVSEILEFHSVVNGCAAKKTTSVTVKT
jgi:hypothetical protein